MLRQVCLAIALAAASPALAQGDELLPVPPQTILGKPYGGDDAASRIRFINVRDRPARIVWIGFDGRPTPYGVIAPGEEMIQPTYVAHRWLVEDALDGQPLHAYISTRSVARDNGATPIAIIR